ncbi:MAG: DUF5666 domain-containing protein [Burkholderiales bacterium]|nr:DUF5666 domain-containing protein [Burkholderiales bacterium]
MTHASSPQAAPRGLALVAGLALLLLAACGAETKTGSNGTGRTPDGPDPTVASGPLNGLGPLEVGGASLQESGTSVLVNSTFRSGTADLRLGMTANANGTASIASGAGVAAGAVAQSIVQAPVTMLDAGAQTLALLGLSFQTDQNTLFEGVESLAQIVIGDEVEAFGMTRPGSRLFQATRIIVRRPATGRVELLGTLDTLAGTAAQVQGVSVNLANAQVSSTSPTGISSATPAGISALSTGTLARISGTLNAATGTLIASSVISSLSPARVEGDVVFLEGFVREVPAQGRFRIADLEVDAAGVTLFAGSVNIGTRIKVRGKMRGGVMRAEAAEIILPAAQIEYALEGQISDYSTISSFTVRGERIDASQAAFGNGAASNLGAGRTVRIKGRSANGKLLAREVVFLGG